MGEGSLCVLRINLELFNMGEAVWDLEALLSAMEQLDRFSIALDCNEAAGYCGDLGLNRLAIRTGCGFIKKSKIDLVVRQENEYWEGRLDEKERAVITKLLLLVLNGRDAREGLEKIAGSKRFNELTRYWCLLRSSVKFDEAFGCWQKYGAEGMHYLSDVAREGYRAECQSLFGNDLFGSLSEHVLTNLVQSVFYYFGTGKSVDETAGYVDGIIRMCRGHHLALHDLYLLDYAMRQCYGGEFSGEKCWG